MVQVSFPSRKKLVTCRYVLFGSTEGLGATGRCSLCASCCFDVDFRRVRATEGTAAAGPESHTGSN